MKKDIQLEMFKKLVPYLRGALWWAQNDLIKDRQSEFNQSDDRIGHPLLSVSTKEVTSRFGVVPMLVGTSGETMKAWEKSKCITVTGLTRRNPAHCTYFGSIVLPGRYEVQDLMDGVRAKQTNKFVSYRGGRERKKDEQGFFQREEWHRIRTMLPNPDKPMVTAEERQTLDKWCAAHCL